MESRNAPARLSLRLPFALSLLVHAAVLFFGAGSTGPAGGPAADAEQPPGTQRMTLSATLARPPAALPAPTAPTPPVKPAAAPQKAKAQAKLNAPAGVWANRSWSAGERAEMKQFLDELSAQARPPSGRELAQKALAAARQSGRSAQGDAEYEAPGQPTAGGKPIEPFSLEMYFDAFVRKLNRSAAFVRNDPRPRGAHKALVEIALNADGSLKSYRVLRSGDQAAEIAYIKSVIERAAPFSAFPPDIRNTRDSLAILMCIFPANAGGGGGGFSRSFSARDCTD